MSLDFSDQGAARQLFELLCESAGMDGKYVTSLTVHFALDNELRFNAEMFTDEARIQQAFSKHAERTFEKQAEKLDDALNGESQILPMNAKPGSNLSSANSNGHYRKILPSGKPSVPLPP